MILRIYTTEGSVYDRTGDVDRTAIRLIIWGMSYKGKVSSDIEPADFRCPTLWLVGSEDRYTMASFKEYEGSLKGSRVQVHILEGLDHEQVFSEIDRVFPTMLAFTKS